MWILRCSSIPILVFMLGLKYEKTICDVYIFRFCIFLILGHLKNRKDEMKMEIHKIVITYNYNFLLKLILIVWMLQNCSPHSGGPRSTRIWHLRISFQRFGNYIYFILSTKKTELMKYVKLISPITAVQKPVGRPGWFA